MKNLKIGAKIYLSFGIVILMMIIVAGTVLITSMQTIVNIGGIDADTRLQLLLSELQAQYFNAQLCVEAMYLQYDESTYAEYEEYIQGSLRVFDSIYQCIDENPALERFRADISERQSEMLDWHTSVTEIRQINLLCDEGRAEELNSYKRMSQSVNQVYLFQVDSLKRDAYTDIDINARIERADRIKGAQELVHLVDSSSMEARLLMQNYDNLKSAEVLERVNDAIAFLDGFLEKAPASDVHQIEATLKNMRLYYDCVQNFISDSERLYEIMVKNKQISEKTVNGLDEFMLEFNRKVNAQVNDTNRLANIAFLVVVVITVAALVSAFIMATIINSGICRPMVMLREVLQQIGAKGNLSLSPEMIKSMASINEGKDEIAQAMKSLTKMSVCLMQVGSELDHIADGNLTVQHELLSEADSMGIALKKMVGNLNNMFHEINNSAVEVSNDAKHVSENAHTLAKGSYEQTSAVNKLSESITEIAIKTKNNAEHAAYAAGLSENVRNKVERGAEQMRAMLQSVKEINDASKSISMVMKVIDDIAFQTNILALNAAVEAARAGQHGKGFAVVAAEVRNLAAKSAAAAGDTGILITSSMEKAKLGALIAEETAASLTEIVAGINETTKIISDIALSSEEQSAAIGLINHGIEQVTKVIHQNSATADESANISTELTKQSELLNDLLNRFKLSESRDKDLLLRQPSMHGSEKDGADVYISLPG